MGEGRSAFLEEVPRFEGKKLLEWILEYKVWILGIRVVRPRIGMIGEPLWIGIETPGSISHGSR